MMCLNMLEYAWQVHVTLVELYHHSNTVCLHPAHKLVQVFVGRKCLDSFGP